MKHTARITVLTAASLLAAWCIAGETPTRNQQQTASPAAHRPRIAAAPEAPAAPQHAAVPTVSASAALKALREGNGRFVAGESIHPHESIDYRSSLANEQHPFATVLACSDSRVTPVLIFDQGIGDLFVIRVAGNIVDEDVAGSIEYAVGHLNTKLLIVLGHENCGAVTAAYHAFIAHDAGAEPKETMSLLRRLEPAVNRINHSMSEREQIQAGVEENVREAMSQLVQIPYLHQACDEMDLEVVGAVYSVSTGQVRFLDD